MPRKIINIDDARKRGQEEPRDLYALLTRIDELEDALETLDDLGITTRDELEKLIGQLEAEAQRLDRDPRGE